MTPGAAITRAHIRGAAVHVRRLVAARLLLDQWGRFATYVSLAQDAQGVPFLEMHPFRPAGVCWHVSDDDAEEVLVATVAGGAQYLGWDEVLKQAERIGR